METIFLALPLAILLGSMSPGPSFVVVARASAADSRSAGALAAVGMGLGSVLFSTAALLGFAKLLESSTWLYVALKVLGASYLLYLAIRLWRSAPKPLEIVNAGPDSRSRRRWLSSAFAAQISNPKTAVFYASIFASLLPPGMPVWAFFVLPLIVFVIETGWYSVVAVAFSRPSSQQVYLRAKTFLDRAAAAVIGALGVRLAATVTQHGI